MRVSFLSCVITSMKSAHESVPLGYILQLYAKYSKGRSLGLTQCLNGTLPYTVTVCLCVNVFISWTLSWEMYIPITVLMELVT